MYDHIRNYTTKEIMQVETSLTVKIEIKLLKIWADEKNTQWNIATESVEMKANTKKDDGKPKEKLESCYKRSHEKKMEEEDYRNKDTWILLCERGSRTL